MPSLFIGLAHNLLGEEDFMHWVLVCPFLSYSMCLCVYSKPVMFKEAKKKQQESSNSSRMLVSVHFSALNHYLLKHL